MRKKKSLSLCDYILIILWTLGLIAAVKYHIDIPLWVALLVLSVTNIIRQ